MQFINDFQSVSCRASILRRGPCVRLKYPSRAGKMSQRVESRLGWSFEQRYPLLNIWLFTNYSGANLPNVIKADIPRSYWPRATLRWGSG